MKKENQGYWVVIPAQMLENNPTKALLYGLIGSYSMTSGECFASNKTLAQKLGKKSISPIRQYLTELESEGWIAIENRDSNKRKIFITRRFNGARPAEKTVGQPAENSTHSSINGEESNSNSCEAEASQGEWNKEIPLIMEHFVKINPSISYGNKTQRAAVKKMLDKWGFEKVEGMVQKTIAIQTEPYAPTATTPAKMWNKIGELAAFFEKRKKKGGVIGL